jgi:hypothetical protein
MLFLRAKKREYFEGEGNTWVYIFLRGQKKYKYIKTIDQLKHKMCLKMAQTKDTETENKK